MEVLFTEILKQEYEKIINNVILICTIHAKKCLTSKKDTVFTSMGLNQYP